MKQLNQTETNSPAKITPKSVRKEYFVDPDWDEVKREDLDFLRTNNGKENYY